MTTELPDKPVASATAAAISQEDDSFVPRYFDAESVRLTRSPMGSPRLTAEGYACFPNVVVRRIRPLSEPDRHLSFWAGDDREIGILIDPSGLDAESARILREELDKRYFTPVITKIFQVKERFGVHDWTVETTRGKASFAVRGLHQNVRFAPPFRLLVTDVRGNRYDIPDVRKLDAHSFQFVKRHL